MYGFWLERIPPGFCFRWTVTNGNETHHHYTLEAALADLKSRRTAFARGTP